MVRRRRRHLFPLSAAVLLAALAGLAAAVVRFGVVVSPPPAEADAGGPRRLPVAGLPGFHVVVGEGGVVLETPDGVRPPAALKDVAAGRLFVVERGVVVVPDAAVVTYVGEDRVVTYDAADGTSAVYHVDGTVVRRE